MAGEEALREPRRLHEAAWPDMFTNLQAAYAELTQAQFELERRAGELGEAHDLFQRVVESMSEALFLIDCAGRLLQVNAAATALLGCAKEELVGKSFAEVCGCPEIPATPWDLLQRAASGTLTNQDVELRTARGTVPVSVSCGLVRDKRGKITGILAVARDVTERKRAEEALERQAQDLARSNAELQQFAYVASHDLQEPLRMIASFADLLARRYQGRLDADADEFIQYVVDGSKRMQGLIHGLLQYSRVGRQTPFQPVPCSEVLQAVLANLRAAIEESGAEVSSDPLPVVRGQETQLAQLFQNLIGNALKFRRDRPPRVHVGAVRQAARWLFSVHDNGIGIERQYADRIFLIFQRLHTRREYPGAGLGLAICKKIVENHGGQIWFESEPGAGTTFFFTLPAWEEAG